jgi:uncharacterized membrane protein (DUF4010 family)
VDRQLVFSLGVSFAVGLLIGLERQRAIIEHEGAEVLPGGVRTFPLIALAGSLAAILSVVAPWSLPVGILGVVALLAAHRLGLPANLREAGSATDIAALVTFLLGAFVVSPIIIEDVPARLVTTAGLAVVVTLLLSIKPRLHAAVRKVSVEDIFATLQLLLVAIVLLPLLPNESYGPFEAINPQQIGRMILLVGSVSFVGYVASRLLGSGRGLTITGFVGGLVSSTAVTFAMSRRARIDERVAGPAAVAVVAASAMMFLRVLVAVAIVYTPLVARLAVPMSVMAIVGGLALVRLRQRSKREEADEKAQARDDLELKNPFELKSAVAFGLMFAGVIFVSKAAQATVGPAALYLTAVVAGTTDVDAITLSSAALAREGLAPTIASSSILIACFSNTAVKAGITFVSGGRAFGWRVATVFGAMIGAGAVALVIMALV